MRHGHQVHLERLGLSDAEARMYLMLLRKGGPFGASALAAATRIPRSTVYLTLNALLDRGLIEAEAGYAGRFSAVPADKALPSLIEREAEELVQRQNELAERRDLASELGAQLQAFAPLSENNLAAELIQVLRDPRAVRDRVAQLQLEAKRQIDVFTKPPYFNRSNPGEHKSLRRGVRVRSLYERAALDTPEIKPLLAGWIAAGEEARVLDGELPHKLAIFDTEVVVMPLLMPGDQTRTLLIRHAQLAKSLGLGFEYLWDRAEPIRAGRLHPVARRSAEPTKKNSRVKLVGSTVDAGKQEAEILRTGRNGRHNKNQVVDKEKR